MKVLKSIGMLILAGCSLNLPAEETAKPAEMTVYRSPTCGCCENWLEHVKESGIKIKDVVSDDMQAIKAKLGLPDKLASCHTAVIDGYVIEGHVPAADIQRLLQTKPKVLGIAAPGMPMGSPGMEVGNKKDEYEVKSFDKDGHFEVFASHGGS